MKNQMRFVHYFFMIVLLSSIILLTYCEKSRRVQTFNDVFDISGITDLNNNIDTVETIDGLYSLVGNPEVNIPAELDSVSFDELINYYEQNIELTSNETDLLLQNDLPTFLAVIDRFGTLPPPINDGELDSADLEKSDANIYLVELKEDISVDYYPDDLYASVKAYQDYLKNCELKHLKKLKKLKEITLKNPNKLPAGAIFLYYKLIHKHNHKKVWWSYWRYGNIIYKIQHKGGKNSH